MRVYLMISYLHGKLVKPKLSRNVKSSFTDCGCESANIDNLYNTSSFFFFRSVGLEKTLGAFIGDDSAV